MTTADARKGPTVAGYATWQSPVGIDEVIASGIALRELGSDGEDLYWVESVPGETARLTLLRMHRGGVEEVTPAPCSVRSRVDEYGGGSWAARDGAVVWCDDATGQVMLRDGAGRPQALTPADRTLRYAAFVPCRARCCVIAIREDHRDPAQVVTSLVALAWLEPEAAPGAGRVLARGADFYADPAWDGDELLAWVEWDQPCMPWDATRLQVAKLVGSMSGEGPDLAVARTRTLAGGPAEPGAGVSVQHPVWAPDGSLLFTADASGWWNLHRWVPASGRPPGRLTEEPCDEDQPLWQLGRNAFAVAGQWVYYVIYDRGGCRLARVPLEGGAGEPIAEFSEVDALVARADRAAALVRRPDGPPAIAEVDASGLRMLHAPAPEPDPAVTPRGSSLAFEGRHGRVQAWYFAPHNDAYRAPAGQLPPVILTVHGGPTARATDEYDPQRAFWTSRGYGVLAVNYSGSSGFGRAYRERLRGAWGVADVDDCVDAARMLAERGLADPARLIIAGGSAGGFTVLACLTGSSVFAAGVTRYGIADLAALQASGTHKFEAYYNDGLLGPWPQARELYEERSPINHLDRLATPMLIMQGLDDPVVPPDQARALARAVRGRGLPLAVVLFEGEGHGFRLPATRRRVLECQLSFFTQLFGLTPTDEVPRLVVENL